MTDLLSHWRKMYANKYLGAWDLCDAQGRYREVSAQIADVRWEEIVGEGGRKESKLVLSLRGSKGPIPQPMILSKPNGKTLEAMFGANPRQWIGKTVTIYALDKKVKGGPAKVLTIRSTKGSRDMADDLERRGAVVPPPDAFDDQDAAAHQSATSNLGEESVTSPKPEPDGRL